MAAMWVFGFLLASSYCQSWGLPADAKAESRVVYPLRVDSQGHVISPDVTSGYHHHARTGGGGGGGEGGGGRLKRGASEGRETSSSNNGTAEENLYIVINKDNEELFLRLTPNTKLITPYTVIEWVMGDGRRILKQATGDCFYVGRLQDAEQSLVAISNCNGLTGYIQTQNESYFIEPLKGSRPPDEGAADNEVAEPQPHLIYKVDSVTSKLNISFQQDQEFQEEEEEEEEGEEGGVKKEGERRPDRERDVTFLEIDDLFRKKRSASLSALRPVRSKRSALIKNIKSKRRKRLDSLFNQGQGSRLRRSVDSDTRSSLPKFARNKGAALTTPKFTRSSSSSSSISRPKYADRQSRSTGLWRPKFYVAANASSGENERQKREDGTPEKGDGVAAHGPRNETETSGGGGGRDASTAASASAADAPSSGGSADPYENEIQTGEGEEEKKTKKKNRKNKKNCKKRGKASKSKGNGVVEEEEEEEKGEVDEEDLKCKSRKPKRKLDKAERQRRKQERRERKRKKREQKRKERERKRLLREKKRQEREKRRLGGGSGEEEGGGGGGGKEEETPKFRNGTTEEETATKTSPTSTTTASEILGEKAQDPFEGEPWDGYSPDLFWETDIAAGSSALKEVSAGPPLNVTDPPKWLELVVAVDNTVIDFHGEDEVEKYVFTLFNIVSAIYEDPSLESSMELVMLRIIFYKDEQQSQVRKGLAKKSLEAVNRWAERLHRVSPLHLRHDLAVWLTKSDLGGPSGYAPVSGVCQPSRSCTLNRDEGLTSAFIIAHEMGHVLGLSHDGDRGAGNTCQDEGFQGSVMAPLVAATFSRFHWSKCSKKEYHGAAGQWSCMFNKPQWKNATKISSSIQYQYSLDDQCRMEFGEGYALCRTFGMTDPCTHLWCSNSSVPHLCKTKKGPPLEGTSCGDQKWCRNGFCESTAHETAESDGQAPVRHNPQDGGWSSWSDWGPCSRTCGTGVSFKTRACDNPPPAWGGRRCRGKREEWKLCGKEECPPPHHDFRAQQCNLLQRIAKLDPRRAALTWQPYEAKKRRKKCKISCYSRTTNEVYLGRENLIDGTPCSYDSSDDLCVQGKCISVGCDQVIGSSAKRDECGVCRGDGGTCTKHEEIYQEIPSLGYTPVAVLPIGARSILIQEETSTLNFLALSKNSSAFILNGGRSQEPPNTFISEGVKFHYTTDGEREMLEASGPLLNPVTVMVHGSPAQEPVKVLTTFYTPVKEEYFQWEIGPFTACSATCGGGTKHETLICRDRRTDREVFHDRCKHLPRPPLNSTQCNTFGCEAKWMVGPWEHCSTTCGPHGVQERMVSCVTLPHAHFKNWTEGIVDPLRCHDHPKPKDTRPCQREACPAHWEPVGWSECSVTCGVGEQEQLLECMGGGGNEVTYECGPRPKEMRACIKPSCSPPPCQRDASEFCQLPVLYKYCKLPKYNILCCHTCANVVH